MKKIKIVEIAKSLSVTHSAVSQWFSGRTNPSLQNAIKMDAYFDISINAWKDIKIYLQNNNNNINKNNTQV